MQTFKHEVCHRLAIGSTQEAEDHCLQASEVDPVTRNDQPSNLVPAPPQEAPFRMPLG